MPVRKRQLTRRQALDEPARAWLDGDDACGFFQFKDDDDLAALWLEHGNQQAMFWRRSMLLPITRDDLAVYEDEWLSSGDNDQYGLNSYFIYAHYSDDEKQDLWDKRGDKTRFRWCPGMKKPQLIENR